MLKDWSIPIVFTWYLIRCHFNMPLRTTHCCSNVSFERTESITLVIIIYLIHLTVWTVLPSFQKHIYSLLTGGNIIVVCKFNKFADVAAIRCAWSFGVEVVGMLHFFFLVFQKTLCRHYCWCLNRSGWNVCNTKQIFFIFVSNIRDRSYC